MEIFMVLCFIDFKCESRVGKVEKGIQRNT